MELEDVARAVFAHEASSKARMEMHEANSEHRFEKLSSQLSGITSGDTTMSTHSVKNVFEQPSSAALLPLMAAGFHGLQNAVATNSNLIVGNTGMTSTGAQTANPVNVKA